MKNFLNMKYGIFILLTIGLFSIFNINLEKYYLITVGEVSNVENDEIIIETDNETEGYIGKIAVYTYNKPTIYQFILSKFKEELELRENTSSTSYDENLVFGSISKENSLYNSVVSAYNLVDEEDVSIDYETDIVLYGISKDSVNGHLPIGTNNTIISSIDSVEVDTTDELKEVISQKECGSKHDIVIEYDDKVENTFMQTASSGDSCYLNLYLYDETNVISSKPSATFNINPKSYGGSAGLMQSINVYNKLTDKDITKGKTIVGTGTIDVDGNVGAIGGAYQKFYAAHYINAYVMFVVDDNSDNYSEAVRAKEKLNSNVRIVKVKTLTEAIEYLEVSL